MDKNKAQYKVEGLPPIYYTNLDRSPDRKEYMEKQFAYWGITDYTRISGYDGTGEDDLSGILKGRYPRDMNSKVLDVVHHILKQLSIGMRTLILLVH